MKKILILFVFLLMSTNSAFAAFDDLELPYVSTPYEDGIYHLQDEGIFKGYDYYVDCWAENSFIGPEIYDSLDESEILDTCEAVNWFSPGDTINRAEFLKIVMMSAGYETEGSDCYPDVKDDWFAPFVCAATELGIVDGYDDGYFKPGNDINFVEAAKIIANAYEMQLPEGNGEDWYEPYVKALEGVNAIPQSIYVFDQEMRRGDSAELIYRLYADVTDKWSHSYEGLKAGREFVLFLNNWDISLLYSIEDYEDKLSELAEKYDVPVFESDLVEGVDEQTIEEMKIILEVYMPLVHDTEGYVYDVNYKGVNLFLSPFLGKYNISDEMEMGDISYSSELPEVIKYGGNIINFEVDLDGNEPKEKVRLYTISNISYWDMRVIEVFTQINGTWVTVLNEGIYGDYVDFTDVNYPMDVLTLDGGDHQVLNVYKGKDMEVSKDSYVFGMFDGGFTRKSEDVAENSEDYCFDYVQQIVHNQYFVGEDEPVFENFVSYYRVTLDCDYSVVFDRKNLEGGLHWQVGEDYEVYLEDRETRTQTYLFEFEGNFKEVDREETWQFEVVEEGVVRMYKDDWEYFISLEEKTLLTDY